MGQEILESRFADDEIVRKYDRIASISVLSGILMESRARRRTLNSAGICFTNGYSVGSGARG